MRLLWLLYSSFFRIGLFTFGGGLTMLPMLKREVVDKHEWISEDEMLDIYAIGQCTPGIIAVNTATYIGYKKGGLLGAFFSTLGQISPSIILILIIASALSQFMNHPILLSAFAGVRVVVCGMMLNTVYQMTKKNVCNWVSLLLFLIAIALIMFTSISTIYVVILAGIFGIVMDFFSKKGAR